MKNIEESKVHRVFGHVRENCQLVLFKSRRVIECSVPLKSLTSIADDDPTLNAGLLAL